MEPYMYPRFKVREQEHQPSPPENAGKLLFSKVTETPFVEGCCNSDPAKENRFDSPQSILGSPTPCVPKSTGTSISASKDSTRTKDRHVGEDNICNIRAGSVLRPRAVLSSPDNDKIMGKRNKIDNQRSPALKNRDAGMNSPAGTNSITNREKAETPVVVRKEFKVAPSSVCASDGKPRKLSRSGSEKAESPVSRKRQFKVASKSNSSDC